jgi:hypothetical protein
MHRRFHSLVEFPMLFVPGRRPISRGLILASQSYRLRIKTKPTHKMIYLATYNRKSEIQQSRRKFKSLIFIEADDKLAREGVVALIKRLTEGDFEESSVEIIGQKAWDAAKIRHPRIKFYKLD